MGDQIHGVGVVSATTKSYSGFSTLTSIGRPKRQAWLTVALGTAEYSGKILARGAPH